MTLSSAGSGTGLSTSSDVLLGSAPLEPILTPSAPSSILDALSGQMAGVDKNSSAQQDTMQSLGKELTALVGKVDASEKPAEKGPVVSQKTADAHGANKQSRVEEKQSQLAADAKIITGKMAALQEGPTAKPSGGRGSFIGGQIVGAVAAAAITSALPPVGAAMMIMDAGDVMAFAGKGTEATFNNAPSEFGRPSSGKSSNRKDAGYVRHETAPAQALSTTPPPLRLMPIDMTNGPGFGPKPPAMGDLAKTKDTLTDPYMKGIDFKIEDTVRGKSLNAALKDSKDVQNLVAKINDRGLEDPNHVEIATKRGLISDNQLKQSAHRPMTLGQ